MIGEITGTGIYPQYYASPSAMQEYVLETELEGSSPEYFEWMQAHPDAIWLRWKDGVPVDDEEALKAASLNAIVGDWVSRNVEMNTENGKAMFRLKSAS